MAKKFKNLVYSTSQNWEQENVKEDSEDEVLPQDQKLRIRLETKQRGGKKATIINGFIGTNDQSKSLLKELKTKLGVGGSVVDDEILIQGDKKDKTIELLKKMGYSNTK